MTINGHSPIPPQSGNLHSTVVNSYSLSAEDIEEMNRQHEIEMRPMFTEKEYKYMQHTCTALMLLGIAIAVGAAFADSFGGFIPMFIFVVGGAIGKAALWKNNENDDIKIRRARAHGPQPLKAYEAPIDRTIRETGYELDDFMAMQRRGQGGYYR